MAGSVLISKRVGAGTLTSIATPSTGKRDEKEAFVVPGVSSDDEANGSDDASDDADSDGSVGNPGERLYRKAPCA